MAQSAFENSAPVGPGDVRAQLDRILASKGFASSASIARFFRFIVEETLSGRSDGLKEFHLGAVIFARGENFDPRIDPIVRVQARNLRIKLERYYSEAGAEDPVRIDLPKGCYVPVFSYRAEPAPERVEAVPAAEVIAPPPAVAADARIAMPGWVTATLCLLLLLGAGFVYQLQRNGVAAARGSADRQGSVIAPDTGSEARSLYLRGRYLLDRHTERSLNKSLECFRQAVSLEPNYAAAWAGLADALDVMAQFGIMPPGEAMAEARRAAQKALALDPNLAEAHLAMAAILEAYDWNWKSAEREYKRAIELNPKLPGAHAWYGMFLRDQGRLAEAIPELELAYRLDPISVVTAINLAHAYACKGDVESAMRFARISAELEPQSPKPQLMLASLLRRNQQPEEAEAALQRATELAGRTPHALAMVASAYVRSGRKEQAGKMLDELRGLSRERYVSPYSIAVVYMAMHDVDRAMPYLEAAYRERSTGLLFLRDEKWSAQFRSSRRFRELINRMRFQG